MNKELIKKRFSRKLNSYNENAKIQKQMAENLIKSLTSNCSKQKYNSILEIGCGTGLLTELAVKNLVFDNYAAVDIVPDCESYIKKINSDIDFFSNDVESFINTTQNKYDLILSNASFQWIEDLPDFIHKLIEKLNENGILLFSSFGKENFREIYYVLGKTLSYYSIDELNERLKLYTPNIEEEVRVLAFETPKDVLKHIQSTGVNALSSEAWTKQDLLNFEKEYNAFCAGHPTLTYHPLYVLIRKQKSAY